MNDLTNGYDAVAEAFEHARSDIGALEVRAWAAGLVPGAEVLDVACGVGIPITQALLQAGCRVHAIDASPRMVERFKMNFRNVPVLCDAVETMTHFGRQFDGVFAWGVVFLLAPDAQSRAISNLAGAVRPGGQLLFTAPGQVAKWKDILTTRDSYALGAKVYKRLIDEAGLTLIKEFDDEGDNHYYQAGRNAP